MRVLLANLLMVLTLLLSTAPPAGAQVARDPCVAALTVFDLPDGLMPAPLQDQDPATPIDPNICNRLFMADAPGPNGVSLVRSLIITGPSPRQSTADFAEYGDLLEAGGWLKGSSMALGDDSRVFTGGDDDLGLYAVQMLVRHGNVVAVTEANGVGLSDNPGFVLDLARLVDRRLAPKPAVATPRGLPTGSIWPAVSQPTRVVDALLTSPPVVGNALNIQLGGFSGLVSLDREGTQFLAVTDRGPNAEIGSGRNKFLSMPLPAYTPSIVRLELRDGQLAVTSRLGLRLPDGYTDPRTGSAFVTGLPNTDVDQPAFDLTGRTRWGSDPYGVDTEGIALDPRDGGYWLCEEYGPSILKVASNGAIQFRLTPEGTGSSAPGANVRPILPTDLARRKMNRGLEGIAISPDGSRLFAIMQSPLSNPDLVTGERSRNVRLLTLDLTGQEPRVDGMYVYLTEAFERIGAASQDDVKVGDLVAASQTRVLVAERDGHDTGSFKMVYQVDLAGATNFLAQRDFGGRTLEQVGADDLAVIGITPLTKQALVNLSTLGWQQGHFEGLTLVDESTIAAITDNNFGFGGLDNGGRLLANGITTRLSIIHLPSSVRD